MQDFLLDVLRVVAKNSKNFIGFLFAILKNFVKSREPRQK